MAVHRYHSFLRIGLLVVLTVLVFDGGFVSPVTKLLSDRTIEYVASTATGVYAGVPQTEINELSAQLLARQREIELRESVLLTREIEARDFGERGNTDVSTYILSSILFILTMLIVWNYVLDWMRVKQMYREKQTV